MEKTTPEMDLSRLELVEREFLHGDYVSVGIRLSKSRCLVLGSLMASNGGWYARGRNSSSLRPRTAKEALQLLIDKKIEEYESGLKILRDMAGAVEEASESLQEIPTLSP